MNWNYHSIYKRPIRLVLKVYRHARRDGIIQTFRKIWRRLSIKASAMNMNRFSAKVSRDIRKNIPWKNNFSVLFVIGCNEGESKRYRVYNVAEYLRLGSLSAKIIGHHQIPQYLSRLDGFDIVCLSRVAHDSMAESMISEARKRNIITIFDIDDLVFEPSVIKHVDAIKDWGKEGIEDYRTGVLRYRQALERCDYFLGTNDFLAEYVKKYNKKSFVLRNALNSVQIAQSAEALKNRKDNGKSIHVGYFSGTPTHQRDFLEVEDALLRILEKHQNVKFLLGGYLELSNKFDKFKDRVVKIPFVDWRRLPFEKAKLDINLAPLEVGNPFCESKSELKYFEAAILKIPTVASPTDSFKFSIKDGVNGFLASNSDEWFEKIEKLITDKGLRSRMGNLAFQRTIEDYSPQTMKVRTVEVFNSIIDDYRKRVLKIEDNKLVINWLIPEPFAGSGGHRSIFKSAKYLRKFGHYVRLYSTVGGHNFKDSENLGKFIDSNFFPTGAEYHLGVEDFKKADASIATHWSTVDFIWKNKDKAKKLFYYVQDYEPLFYPMGNDYIEAENTYRLGLNCIASGPWCAKILRERFNADVDYFRFPIDNDVYYPRTHIPKRKKVVFFSRPETPRRCYSLGIKALEIFSRNNPNVEIVLYGSKDIDSGSVPFKHTNKGLVDTTDHLAELYSGATVGIAFSTTNPSLTPYEMMACGLPVIDLDYEDNWTNYGSSKNLLLVPTLPEKIAEGIEKVINDEGFREELSKNGMEFVKDFPDEEGMVKKIESLILKEFSNPS